MEDTRKVEELENRIKELEDKFKSSPLYSQSRIKRSIAVFGHNILGQIIFLIPFLIIISIFLDLAINHRHQKEEKEEQNVKEQKEVHQKF